MLWIKLENIFLIGSKDEIIKARKKNNYRADMQWTDAYDNQR